MFSCGGRHAKKRSKFCRHVFGQKAFAVSEPTALITRPRHEAHGGEQRYAVSFPVPTADAATQHQRRSKRNAAPHVPRNQSAFITTASAKHPAEKNSNERGCRRQREYEACRSS